MIRRYPRTLGIASVFVPILIIWVVSDATGFSDWVDDNTPDWAWWLGLGLLGVWMMFSSWRKDRRDRNKSQS
jgi:hypothetical protein